MAYGIDCERKCVHIHFSSFPARMVVKRHELLQRQLEKAESDLSLKAEVKETLQKSVSIMVCQGSW